MRSAYRATLAENKGSFNIGLCLVRNAVSGTGNIISAGTQNTGGSGSKVLIAFFSWGGNTKGIAEEFSRGQVQICLKSNLSIRTRMITIMKPKAE